MWLLVYQLKTPQQLALMRRAGLVVWQALKSACKHVQPGVTTAQLNQVIEQVFQRYGAEPVFKNRPGRVPFPAASCISINEELIHGIPGPRRIQPGDLVTLDTGCRLQGWCADAAVSVGVPPLRPHLARLLQVAQQTLQQAIDAIPRASTWGAVVQQMATFVRRQGFGLVEEFVGHGIGRQLHEKPDVPHHPAHLARTRADFPLEPGLVIAVEPMITLGRTAVHTRADHWTVVTADGLPAVHVEHTVAVTPQGGWVLTGPPNPEEKCWLQHAASPGT